MIESAGQARAGHGADPYTVAVIGAGSVGATTAYALMMRGLARRIVLNDVVAERAEAEADDLAHGCMYVPSVEVQAGSLDDCAGARVVIVTAGAKQKPGQSRLELVGVNVGIFRNLIPKLVEVAPEAILLIVTNPVDVLTYAARKLIGGAQRIFGTGTVLDTSRFRYLIAQRMGVAVGNVHAHIVGEHGDSEVPLWSSARIGNISLDEFRPSGLSRLTDNDRAEIARDVRQAAGRIIRDKGATNWAIGLTTARIVEAIARDETAILTVSRLLRDYCGIDDVCLSVPSLVSARGVGDALVPDYDRTELTALRKSAAVIQDVIRQAGL
ncbi:MAG TPA: L-lactate dehydrogenase [Phycisphaerae bacterium]|nr:L-lactate dehydrogenase [Phycisphaerae bacterium]